MNYHAYLASPEWHRKASKIQRIMFKRCAVLPFLKSSDTHHMTYRNLEHEMFLRDCVPLSKFIHRDIVHPVSRLFHRKHDIKWIRFCFNWLLLRPSCLFWFIWLGLTLLFIQILGRKIPLTVIEFLVLVFGYLAIANPIYWLACYVLGVSFFVFKEA